MCFFHLSFLSFYLSFFSSTSRCALFFCKASHLQLTAEQDFGSRTKKNAREARSALEERCSGKPFTHYSFLGKAVFSDRKKDVLRKARARKLAKEKDKNKIYI